MFDFLANLFNSHQVQNSEPLTFVEIPSQKTQHYSVIWLHGLGSDGYDFHTVVPQLLSKIKNRAHIRFIFPHAPMREMMTTGERRVTMRSWYDISEIVLNARADYNGINQSAAAIHQLIDQEVGAGIASENILLVGFSQGGCIALHSGLCCPRPLAGILALSTYLSTVDKLDKQAAKANFNIPIFMAHGTDDRSVALENAQAAFNALKSRGYPIQWHEYPAMGHQVCNKELADIAHFINQIFH